VVVAGGGIGYVVEVVVEEFGCIMEVMVEDWHWVDAAFGRAEVPSSALAGEG
jgi:hypothetical protein